MVRKSDLLRSQEAPTVLGYELDRKTLTPIRRMIDTSKPVAIPLATDDDRALLARHGLEGLKAMGFDGVIDRLSTKR